MRAEVGKPGPNYLEVPPEHRKRIDAIVRYYRKKPHPFTACVRDNRKRFGPRTEQVCAVVKDMAMNTTHWRKGGRKHSLSAPVARTVDLAAVQSDLIQLAEEVKAAGVIDLADSAAEERMEKKGQALPGNRFPIKDENDLKKAVKAFGRAKPSDRPKVKAHIKKRAKALGATHLIPDHWQ